jgi:hypothetical protein
LASLLALALILLPVVLAGCNVKSGGFIISKPAHVRFFNALVDGGSINVTIGDNAVLSGLPFEGLTSYEDIDSGNREVKISVAGGTSTIVDSTILFTDDASSTYLIYGTSAAPVAQQISDTTTDAGGGQFLMRVTNAAYGSEGFDVYVTPPGTALDNTSPNVSNVPYAITTAFGLFAAGSYQLRMTLPNSKQVIYDAGTLTFNERASYFLVVYTKGSSTLVNAALLNIDTAGDGASSTTSSRSSRSCMPRQARLRSTRSSTAASRSPTFRTRVRRATKRWRRDRTRSRSRPSLRQVR